MPTAEIGTKTSSRMKICGVATPSRAAARSTMAKTSGNCPEPMRMLLPNKRPREIDTKTIPPTTSSASSEADMLLKIAPIRPRVIGSSNSDHTSAARSPPKRTDSGPLNRPSTTLSEPLPSRTDALPSRTNAPSCEVNR